MTYYDQTFEPWKIIDGKCVVADEAEWQKLATVGVVCGEAFCATQETDAHIGNNERPIVKVPDLFEDVTGPVVDQDGKTPYVSLVRGDAPEMRAPIGCRDIVNRLFRTIDSTPHVDYLIVTQRPELVRSKWQNNMPENVGTPEDADAMWLRHRSNVILAVPVETQADIERLVPELLNCHDLCKGLEVICNPTEKLDFIFKPLLGKPEGYTNFMIEYLSRIIAEGNEHPIHPQWLRSLRDQCLDAVPFHFAGWGEWAPRTTHKENLTGQEQHTAFIDGMPGDEFPEEYRMVKWGRERSGRLLDGQEHNGRLA